MKGKRVLTWERYSIDSKKHNKEKINIAINDNDEKSHSKANNISKKNHKILSKRPNSLLTNQRHSTINSSNTLNAHHLLKKNKKNPSNNQKEKHINKLISSNPNLP